MSSLSKDDFDLMTQAMFLRVKDFLPAHPPADRVEAVRMIREAMLKVLEEERENNTCSFCENPPTHTIGERAEYPWTKDDPICDECEKAHEEEEDNGDEEEDEPEECNQCNVELDKTTGREWIEELGCLCKRCYELRKDDFPDGV